MHRISIAAVSVLSALLFVNVTALATPQIPDILVYEGKEYPIQVELLAAYFERHPDRKPESLMRCSANWRGYQAKFAVSKGMVVLADLVANPCGGGQPALGTAVPNGQTLTIDWYTGILVSSYGKNNEDPYGIASLDAYEKYSLFEVAAGSLGKVKHFDNKQFKAFRKRQFEAFKKTPEYKAELTRFTTSNRISATQADEDILQWMFHIHSTRFLVD